MFQKTDDGVPIEINIFDDGTLYFDIGHGDGVFGLTREQAAEVAKTLTHYASSGELPE